MERLQADGLLLLRYGREGRRAPQVFRVGAPLALGHLDRDQAGQGLGLAGSREGRVFAPDGHGRGRDRVPGHAGAGTAEVRLHGLDVVVVAPAPVGGFAVITLGRTRARAGAAVPRVLLAGGGGGGAVAFDALPLAFFAVALRLRLAAVPLRGATAGLPAPRAVADRLPVPGRRRVLRAPVLLFPRFVVERDRSDDTAEFFCHTTR